MNLFLIKVILVFGLFGFFGNALAFNNDKEATSINLFTAGALSFQAEMGDWSSEVVANDIQPGEDLEHFLNIDTSLIIGNANHGISAEIRATGSLCNQLFVSAYNGDTFLAGGLVSDVSWMQSITGDLSWRLVYSLISNTDGEEGACLLSYEVRSFLEELGYGYGFFDQWVSDEFSIASLGFETEPKDNEEEEDDGEDNENESQDNGDQDNADEESNNQSDNEQDSNGDNNSGSSSVGGFVESPVKLNEIAADAMIDYNPILRGIEWIELYNNGDVPIDVDGWMISELENGEKVYYTIRDETENPFGLFTMSYGTVIPPKGFIVLVFVISDKLDNDGDDVVLYRPDGQAVDGYAFLEAVSSASEGRLPDGQSGWYVTKRTPGLPNELYGFLDD